MIGVIQVFGIFVLSTQTKKSYI